MAFDFNSLFKVLIGVEQVVLPIFVHNANSQKVAGIVLVGEQAASQVLDQLSAQHTAEATNTTVAPAAPANTVVNINK